MYVDTQIIKKKKNIERLKDVSLLAVLIIFLFFEYKVFGDLFVRATHRLVKIETQKIEYDYSGLSLSKTPIVQYQWKGVDYQKPVGGLFLASSSLIAPPVTLLVDPEEPQTAILKTPYGGWSLWFIDFMVLQLLVLGFVYVFFLNPYRLRRKSYFQ